MAQLWEDLGGGQHKLTITDDDGKVPPAIVRGTKDEIIAKLASSKINGDRRINELKGVTVQMSASERMQTVADLQNPAKVDQAITTVVERAIGPISEFQQDRTEEREERQTRLAVDAATAFASSTPAWYPSEHNRRTLVDYMKTMRLSNTNVADYTKAFDALTKANLLQAKPAEAEDEGETDNEESENPAERTAPAPAKKTTTPTRYSTGVRSSDISGQPARPTTRLKYSREQIARLGTKKYKEAMADPEFSKCVDYYAALDSKQRQQRRAS